MRLEYIYIIFQSWFNLKTSTKKKLCKKKHQPTQYWLKVSIKIQFKNKQKSPTLKYTHTHRTVTNSYLCFLHQDRKPPFASTFFSLWRIILITVTWQEANSDYSNFFSPKNDICLSIFKLPAQSNFLHFIKQHPVRTEKKNSSDLLIFYTHSYQVYQIVHCSKN